MKKLLCALAMSAALAGCSSDDKASKSIEYQVGMQRFTLSYDSELAITNPDFARAINVYDSPERKLMVKIWYPAEVDTTTQTPIHYGFHTPKVPLVYDPSLIMMPENPQVKWHIDAYQTYQKPSLTYFEAEPIKKRFPVILHSHGLMMPLESDQRYFETMAEQGYIVVAIGHTDESILVTLDDEQTRTIPEGVIERTFIPMPEIDPNLLMTDEEKIALSEIPLDEIAPLELVEKYRVTTTHQPQIKLEFKHLRRDDMLGVYQQLQALNQGDIPSNLTGLMDLDTIMATGYSYGGITSRLFCEIEDACVATINLDGNSLLTNDERIIKPHLFSVNSDHINAKNEAHSLIDASNSELDIIQLVGASHGTFSQFWIPDLDDPKRDKETAQLVLFSKLSDYISHHLKGTQHHHFCDISKSNKHLTQLYSNTCH